jgi:twitching motility protein PilT
MMTPEQKKTYAETGDADLSYAPENIGRFRVNIHKQRALHAMTMRHVKSKIMSIDELSLPPVLKNIAEAKRGIIIICGTTGSGKSTTLAAMLQHVDQKFPMHVITIEDPIEYEFKDEMCMFEQREVGLDTSSFQSALTHALRQDPDIIMVGEMRDRESFESALQAADTGHLVITTLHATNASQAINRILDFYPKIEQDSIREALAINLRATIAQRLLPKALGGGVIPANEIMINTPVIEKYIRENELDKLGDAIKAGKEDGMITFNASLLQRINNGEISEEVGLEASAEPEALRMNLKGIFVGGI